MPFETWWKPWAEVEMSVKLSSWTEPTRMMMTMRMQLKKKWVTIIIISIITNNHSEPLTSLPPSTTFWMTLIMYCD